MGNGRRWALHLRLQTQRDGTLVSFAVRGLVLPSELPLRHVEDEELRTA